MFGCLALEELVRKFLGVTVSAVEEDDCVSVLAGLSLSNDRHVVGMSGSTVVMDIVMDEQTWNEGEKK